MRAEQLTGPVAGHGEGPVWDDVEGVLRFVDMDTDAVLVLDGDGGDGVRRLPQPEKVTVMRPRRTGGWVLGTRSGFALTDAAGSWERTVQLWDDPLLRMNDGACDPQGRFWSGSMSTEFTAGAGTLHRLDPDLTVTTMLTGLTIPNGLSWNASGELAYFVDSRAKSVDVLLLEDDGSVRGRRRVVDLTDESSVPDGLTLDTEGGIWVAIYDGGEVRRYTADGALDQVVEIGVPEPTACTFGGPGYDQLYITSTQENADLAAYPDSGAVYRIAIEGIRGLPALPFLG